MKDPNQRKQHKYFYLREPEGQIVRFRKEFWPEWFWTEGTGKLEGLRSIV